MKFKKLIVLILLITASIAFQSVLINAQTSVTAKNSITIPSDEEIRQVLIDRIDIEHQSVGMVVGIITPEGRRCISYGRINQNDTRQPDGNTIFEIGSITKVFTALLLSDMIQRGELRLDDPVEKFLPKHVKVPERNGKKIDLIDLATQTSGLPFWPTGIPLNDSGAIIMPKYTVEQLYQFLSTYQLQNDIGTKWAYSNLGFGLLGHALCLHAGTEYESIVGERITKPLKMNSTAIKLSPEMKENLCVGYNGDLKQMSGWNAPLFPGCGSLHSSANDMLTFLEACMGYVKSPLAPAMASMLETRRQGPQLQQALGWWIIPFGADDEGIVTHPGSTFGYSSVISYDSKLRVGVVVLSNSTGGDVGSIAWHILRPHVWPWTIIPKKRKEITLDSKKLDLFTGQYKTNDSVIINIERDSSALILKTPTTPPNGLRLHANNEKSFSAVDVNLQVTFQEDNEKGIKGLIIHFGSTDTPAVRIESNIKKND